MGQSINLTRTMKDLQNVYESVLNEGFNHEEKTHKDDQKVELTKNTGPEAADNFEKAAIDTEALSDKQEKDNHYEPNKFSQKSRKTVKEGINNCTMENDNIFDRLYSTIMESDGTELAYEDEELDAMADDELGLDGEDEEVGIQVTLTPEQIDALLDVLAQVEAQMQVDAGAVDGDDDLEDMDMDDDDVVAEEVLSGEFKRRAKEKAKKLAMLGGALAGGAALAVNPGLRGSLKGALSNTAAAGGALAGMGRKFAPGIGKGLKDLGTNVGKTAQSTYNMNKGMNEAVDSQDLPEAHGDNPKGSNKVGNKAAKGGKAQGGIRGGSDGKLSELPQAHGDNPKGSNKVGGNMGHLGD